MKDTIIGVNLAKTVFQIHVAPLAGELLFRKKIRRAQFFQFMASQPAALVVMDACGSAHYWARELANAGHEVKLIAPQYVRPFVKRQKNDAADAEAIDRADPDRENQPSPSCFQTRNKDLDPIRRSPYRPAAFENAAFKGLTEDRNRSLAHKVRYFLHHRRQPQKPCQNGTGNVTAPLSVGFVRGCPAEGSPSPPRGSGARLGAWVPSAFTQP